MALTWAQCKAGVRANGSSCSDLALFDRGYFSYTSFTTSYIDWMVYTSIADGSYTDEWITLYVYVFGRKRNSASSQNDFKITYRALGQSYTSTVNAVLNPSSGKVRFLGSHEFSQISTNRNGLYNFGATIQGVLSTSEATGTWNAYKATNWTTTGTTAEVSAKTTSSLSLTMDGLTGGRNMYWYNNWYVKKSTAADYTNDQKTNWGLTSESSSITKKYDGLDPCTQYNLRFQYGVQNYDVSTADYTTQLLLPKLWTVSAYTNALVCSAPTVSNKEYNGSSQTGVSGGTGVSLGGTRSATNVGTYTATATPTASYNWTSTGVAQSSKQTKEYTWKITERSMSHCTVTVNTSEYTYDGTAKTPSVTVYDTDLGENLSTSDYSVTYSNNIDPGTATVTITGERNYTGSISGSFTINKAQGQLTSNVSSLSIKRGDTITITLDKHGSTGTITATVTPAQAINNNITVSVSGNTVTVKALAATESTINLVISMGADSYYTADSITIPVTIDSSFNIYVGIHEVTKIYLGNTEIKSVFVGTNPSN